MDTTREVTNTSLKSALKDHLATSLPPLGQELVPVAAAAVETGRAAVEYDDVYLLDTEIVFPEGVTLPDGRSQITVSEAIEIFNLHTFILTGEVSN